MRFSRRGFILHNGSGVPMSETRKQIVILGGGFAGVYTARTLERLLKPGEADVILVNRQNYWVYQPMLPEVISRPRKRRSKERVRLLSAG